MKVILQFVYEKGWVLVPLNDNLDEDTSNLILRVEINKGINVLGRDVMPITDKRLSRKHLLMALLKWRWVKKRYSANTQTRPLIERAQDDSLTQKRWWQVYEDEALARKLQHVQL